MLDRAVFRKILHRFPSVNVDLFVSRLMFQLQRFFNRRPDPFAEATDAFLQDWKAWLGYANPPWNLVGKVLSMVEKQKWR